MKKYRISWLFALVATLVMGLASCTKDSVENDYVDIGQSSVTVNKKGLSDKGQKLSFVVNSSVYWLINVPEDLDWLKVSPRGGFGKTEVMIEALPNYDKERSVTLVLETKDGIRQNIVITQNGILDLVAYTIDNFDGSQTDIDVEVELFSRWNKSGVTSLKTEYYGVGTYVSSISPSAGYAGASGVNNIFFKEDNASFSVANIETMSDETFVLSFGYSAPKQIPAEAFAKRSVRSRADDGMVSAENEPLKLYVAKEADKWIEVPYSIEDNNNAWKQAKAVFKVPIDATNLAFKLVSAVAGARIDDFSFTEGTGEGEYIDFNKVVVEELVVLDEDFSWLEYGSTTFWNVEGQTRIDLWTEEQKAKGWTTSMVAIPNKPEEPLCYGRPGFVIVGKTGYGGDLITPALSKIGAGMMCNLEVTMDVSAYMTEKGTKDDNLLLIEVVGEGTPSVGQMTIDNFATWEGSTRTFTVSGATANTKIRLRGNQQLLVGVGAGKNRMFFDNIKIVAKDLETLAPTVGFPFEWDITAENKTNPDMANTTERWAMSENSLGKLQAMVAVPYSKTPAMSYTATAKDGCYVLMYGFGLNDCWHFTLPVKGLRSGIINMKAAAGSSGSGSKFYIVEYSLDNTEWFAVDPITKIETLVLSAIVEPKEKKVTYTYGLDDAIANKLYLLNANIPVPRYVADGNFYVRLRVAGDMAGNRGKWIVPGNGGTTRLTTTDAEGEKYPLSFTLVE